jgi:hypothetical protein
MTKFNQNLLSLLPVQISIFCLISLYWTNRYPWSFDSIHSPLLWCEVSFFCYVNTIENLTVTHDSVTGPGKTWVIFESHELNHSAHESNILSWIVWLIRFKNIAVWKWIERARWGIRIFADFNFFQIEDVPALLVVEKLTAGKAGYFIHRPYLHTVFMSDLALDGEISGGLIFIYNGWFPVNPSAISKIYNWDG